MHFPDSTPAVVRKAVAGFVRRRRLVQATSTILAGGSVCIGFFLLFVLADRLTAWPVGWRLWGPWLSILTATITAGFAGYYLFKKEDPLDVAIHLDTRISGSRDRWSSSLDFARRAASGLQLKRIEAAFEVTQATTSASSAYTVIPKRGLLHSSAAIYSVVFIAGLFCVSNFFGMPLLWLRFWHPEANLPRDSVVQIKIEGADQTPELTTQPQLLFTLPEGDDFHLKVKLSSRSSPLLTFPASLPEPTLEVFNPDGQTSSVEFTHHGQYWVLTRPETSEPLTFRIRAGDAQTQIFRLNVEPRIRFSKFLHTIRYPKYAKLKDVKDAPLEGERLSLLEDSRLEFDLETDRPIRSIEAVFELLEAKDQSEQMSGKERWANEHAMLNKGETKTGQQKERPLSVKVRREHLANFRMKVDQSGILRVRAVGDNGIPGRERVCVIEATRDLPPRITVSGMPSDSYIMPGELVGFQFRAEDDLAVADVIMDWRTAGAARTHDLAGEFYINSTQLGQRIVTGSETIQRMNYHVYGTTPFEMNLFVIDSKGQEASSEDYRIHLLRDSYAARFASGMEFFNQLDWAANLYRGRVNQLSNNLNIIKTVAGTNKTWPEAQANLLANFTDTASGMRPELDRERAAHFFSGWPQRLQDSIALLLAFHRCLDTPYVYYDFADQIRASNDVPALIEKIHARIEQQKEFGEIWKTAILAEQKRFQGEALLQRVRNLRQRLSHLGEVKSSKDVYEANLKFYVTEATGILATGKSLTEIADKISDVLVSLESALHTATPGTIQGALTNFELVLSTHAPALSSELENVLEQIRQSQLPHVSHRLQVGAAESLRFRSSESQTRPFGDFELARLCSQQDVTENANWYRLPSRPAEVWLTAQLLLERTQTYRRDQQMNRFALNPEAAEDVAAEIREDALILKEIITRAPEPTGPESTQLNDALDRLVRSPAAFNDTLASAVAALQPAGITDLQSMQPGLLASMNTFKNALQRAGDVYEQMAADIEKELLTGGDKVRWGKWQNVALYQEARLRAIETGYRNAHFFRMANTFIQNTANHSWDDWEAWNRLQLLLLIDGEGGFDKVTVRFNSGSQQALSIIPGHARNFAAQLHEHAAVMERTISGQPQNFDFEKFMAETKTLGYLTLLQKEFAEVAGAFASDDPEQKARLSQTRFGKIVVNEGDVRTVTEIANQLKRPATQSELPQMLKTAQEQIQTASEAEELLLEITALSEQVNEMPEKELAQRITELKTNLEDRLSTLYGQVQLPLVNMQRHNNVRDFSQTARTFWPIRAIIDSFDYRWNVRMRDAEIDLMRHLIQFGEGANRRVDLGLDYSRLVAQRARQVGRERRRNRGISYFEQNDGPRLKLPRHIALELMRARNKRPPAQFKAKSEEYYKQLLKDMGN
ncbi:MAG: hypothetical protein O3B01_07535 [Planctomycetota bacterium]|nr:hypothetical protein [Planctomycetota bacterium]